MTAQTLPDEPNFCFCPAYDVETEVQQIRIVFEGLAGHVPTALVTLDLDDALSICDKLNSRLGLDRHGCRLHARRGRRSRQRPLALRPFPYRAAARHRASPGRISEEDWSQLKPKQRQRS